MMRTLLILLLFGSSLCKAGYIPAGHLKVHYEIKGKGTPLIFLHAGYQDMKMWKPQVDYFSRQYQVITIDLPGHGKTMGIDTAIAIKEVLRTCMDSLHLKKASWVGLSLGAACVTDFVLAYPERVEKVILVSQGLSGWKSVLKPDSISLHCFLTMDSVEATKDYNNIALTFTNIWCIGPFRKAKDVNGSVRHYIYQTTKASLTAHADDNTWPQFAQPPAALRMTGFKNPLLLIVGDQDLPIILQECHWMHQTIPGSREVILPHVAHMLNMERPEEFNRLVAEFLSN